MIAMSMPTSNPLPAGAQLYEGGHGEVVHGGGHGELMATWLL